jgi:hypothetical protein
MRFAELYPSVPLQSLVREVLHAQNAVARNAANRAETVDQMVTIRLAGYDSATLNGGDSPPMT